MPNQTGNRGTQIRDILINQFGFKGKAPTFHLQVDGQHALNIGIDPWSPRKKTNGGRLIIGLARRDSSQMRKTILQPNWKEWGTTVTQKLPPFIEGAPPSRFSAVSNTEQDVQNWLETYIPRLLDECCNLPFIKAQLEQQKDNRDATIRQRMIEAMFDGWTDEAEAEFLDGFFIPQLDENWETDPDKSERQNRITQIRAWVDEYPNGIERELAD